MTVSMGNYILSHIAIMKKEESDAKEVTYKEEIQNESKTICKENLRKVQSNQKKWCG